MALSPTSWGTGGGGGGGVPAGNDGEVQYNDSGAFGASPEFVWEAGIGNGILRLVTTENGTAEIIANGTGTQLQIAAGDGDATHVGGELQIHSGDSDGQNGGDLQITAGSDGSADGNGGNITIRSGESVVNDGGDVDLRANGNPAGNNGGTVNIAAGSGVANGGNVNIQAGGPDGYVAIISGNGSESLQADSNGVNLSATKLGFFNVAPVVQPAAPVTIFDVIAALKALGLVAT